MPRTDKEEIGLLKARVGQLESELRMLRPAPSQPATPPKPPTGWPQGDGNSTGINAAAPGLSGRSVPVDPRSYKERHMSPCGRGWKDPAGQWRSTFTDEAIADPSLTTPEPRPIGPDHDRRHQLDVELMDRAFDDFSNTRKE
jgi:hypothetical protein